MPNNTKLGLCPYCNNYYQVEVDDDRQKIEILPYNGDQTEIPDNKPCPHCQHLVAIKRFYP
jgi:hypothetical protein